MNFNFLSFKKRPLVSVIIASYNHVNFVTEALTSVLNQSFSDLEVIVVDDGSTDGTPEVIAQIKDSRLTLIRFQENRCFHPRNVALRRARGKYLAFQNSDDRWAPDKLQKQFESMEKSKKPAACFTAVRIIDERGQESKNNWAENLFAKTNKKNTAWLKYFFDVGNCFCISSALISRSHLKKIGNFKPSLVQLGDFDLWVRLAAVGEFQVLSEPLTEMRLVGNQNLSRPSPAASCRSGLELAEVLNRFVEKPVVQRLGEIFPRLFKKESALTLAKIVELVLYAAEKSPSHLIFADRILSSLLDNPLKREQLLEIFGSKIVQRFIENRGKIALARIDE